MPIQTYFARLQNPDFTVDSICLSCYQTVGTARREADLIAADELHVCDPGDRELFSKHSERGAL
jgi:hypothetical protein